MSGPLIENPRKRKRRRRQDKPAVGARLVLDDHVKGDVGILSEDLFRNLFPAQHRDGEETNGTLPTEVHHIVISPKAPFECVDDLSWTVVPVIPSSALAASTIQFSPSSLALQRFAEDIQRISPSKLLSNSRSGIEVLALDVLPLALDTVFVTLEGDLAKRLENGEGTFHGSGARINGHHVRENAAARPEEKLESAIREALSSLKVVHSGDIFSLPLPPHPITHVPLPPAKVTLCEPVAQGILSAKTRIIVTQTHHHSKNARKAHAAPLNRALEQVAEADEDTSNEQFFSAAEDRYKTDAPIETDESATETDTGVSEDDIDDLSDDSMDDMISLQAPVLPASNASGVSTLQPGTPYTITGRHLSGMKSPGSVFSGFTANTARAGGQKGRLFKAQGLMRPLPDELLRPAPQIDEDEDARVYVDVNSLAKIGCFSGDWVRLETAQEPPSNGMGLWSLGSFGQAHDEEGIWRPVKVYSLPEGYSRKQVTKISKDKHDGRSNSFFESQISKPSSPTAYLSPLLLSNLESPPYLRILALKRPLQIGKLAQPKITSSSRPTFTTEVTILRVETPISSERMLSNACFVALKQHFAEKRRIIKSGDLIAIPIDDSLGRTLYTTNTTREDLMLDEGLSNVETHRNSTRKSAVVWFKVGQVAVAKPEGADQDDEDIWGGVASTDASITTMKQVSSVKSRLPAAKDNTWQYYLRLKEVPGSSDDPLASSMLEPRSHHVTRLRRELRGLIAAATSPRAVHLKMEPIAILLVSTQRNIGKATVATRACTDIGLQTFPIDAYDILSEGGAGGGDVNTAATLQARADRAMTCGSQYCALLIQHIEALTADRMATVLKDILKDLRVLIATTTEVDKIPDGIRGLFTHELEMTAPDEWEREGILRNIIDDQGVSLAADVDLGAVAVKTAALVAGDLVDVVDRSLVARHTRLEALATAACTPETPITLRDIQVAGGLLGRCLTKSDFDLAVEAARKNFADSIGAPKIPNVGWDDVGGLSNVKDAVMETIQLPLERPELFAKGMKKRSGILFYGPPGTGKTLLAKAIATEFSLNFFSVKGPELLNMYIGESEANVRRVFQRARDARPCVVFFDELDSVAPKRGNQGDSGGVMDRIVSQLLAELDGMSDGEDGGGGVFVIGATNRPDLLDQALLRPGRFDKMLYLGVSDTHEKQATIMEALTRKFTMSPNLSLNRVASQLPFTYTGADFYALCSDAMLKAVTRQALLVDSKIAARNASRDPNELKVTHAYFFDHYATNEDVAVLVTEEDFAEAQKELIPSVSFKELDHYKRVREMFETAPKKESNGTEPANAAGTNGTSAGVPGWQLANRTKPGANATPLQGPSPGMGSGPDSKPGMNARLRSKASSFMARDKGKGKGKARLEELGSEDDDEQPGSNRGMGGRGSQNGHAPGTNGFRESVDDDEGLY